MLLVLLVRCNAQRMLVQWLYALGEGVQYSLYYLGKGMTKKCMAQKVDRVWQGNQKPQF